MRVGNIPAILLIALLVPPLFLADIPAQAQITRSPAYITFNDDDPGSPPATGQGTFNYNQPTSLRVFPVGDGSISVEASANGIDTQPVVLRVSDSNASAAVDTRFEFTFRDLRVEATVAFDRLVNGFFLQTVQSPTGPVVTRLQATSEGEIQSPRTQTGRPPVTIGTYEVDQPFRVRMDIDMLSDTWSAVIDNELDGFSDDQIVTGLFFINDQVDIPGVSLVSAGINTFVVSPGPTSIAYDDISLIRPGPGNINTAIPVDIVDKEINICNKSPIKVAALGRPFFDITEIDPARVLLGGTLGTARIRTVGKNEKPQARTTDVDRDGNTDLEVRFVSEEIGLTSESEAALFVGITFDGKQVLGFDTVSVREMMCMRKAAGGFLDEN